MVLKTFQGGIHLHYQKGLAKDKPIRPATLPEEIIIPLRQHAGVPCEPLVRVGDRVFAGQKAGSSDKLISAAVHSSVSGVVRAVEPRPFLTGVEVESIVIRVDREQPEEQFRKVRALEKVTAAEIVEAVKAAGIVGMGGAAFPTVVKLSPPENKKIRIVVINGCECEPYLTCDYRLMLERGAELVAGAKLLLKAVGAEECCFCIEDNKEDAVQKLREAIDDPRISVASVPTKYPQGSEKQLIKVVTGRVVPSGGLPYDIGVLVQNISTTLAVYEAVVLNKPLIERVVTVTGENIKEPANLMVKIGTPIRHLLDQCGGFISEPAMVLVGGPMTGYAQSNPGVPIVKGSNGLVALAAGKADTNGEHLPCMRCGKCVESCPMFLYPNYISANAEQGSFTEAARWDALDCIDCGICTYVCLARRPNGQFIKQVKQKLSRQNIRTAKEGK